VFSPVPETLGSRIPVEKTSYLLSPHVSRSGRMMVSFDV